MYFKLAAIFLTICSLTLTAKETPPNIIYILADDLGYGDLGSYGQQKIKTPYLDQMAQEGMRFTQHYSGSAICAPSRFTLMTGQHIGRSQSYGQGQNLKPEQTTLFTLAKKAGYATGAVGKWGLGKNPNDRGVDQWYGFLSQAYAHFFYPERIWHNQERIDIPENHKKNGLRINGSYTEKIDQGIYIHDEFTKKALEFIKDNHSEPFFLYLPYTIPHLELIVPNDDPAFIEYRKIFPERNFDTTNYTRKGKKAAAGGARFYDGHGYCSSEYPRATYAAMITRLDRDIGKIFKSLKEFGIDDNTLVIFSSDNGAAKWEAGGSDREFFQSNGKLRDGKNNYYEGGIRVPMIARWPGKIKAGITSDHLSYFPDILPTFSELLNQPLKEKIDGLSLLPTLLSKGEQLQHKHLFWSGAVRKGKWKYVKKGRGMLFDLSTDVSEEKNLSSTHKDVLEELKGIYEENKIPKK